MARGYRRLRFYSTSRRILVHLSSTSPFLPAALATLTQEGIATSIRSGRSTVTKWLLRLIASRLVCSAREHVPGRRLRNTVYRLTDSGWMEARRLRRQLETDVVTVRVAGMDPVPMRVSQIPEVFPRVDLTAVVASIRRGIFDLTQLPAATSAGATTVSLGPTVRQPSRFFGRSGDIRTLETWAGSSSKVLVLLGLPGIGKSTLLSTWLLRYKRHAHAFWTDVSAKTTRNGFLADLAAFMTRLGWRGLAATLSESGHPDFGLLVRVLADELHDHPSILVIDNVHQASPEVARLLAEAILPLVRTTRTRVVLISRSLPSFLEHPRTRRAFGVEALRLKGLDVQASRSLLSAKGFEGDEAAAARIIASTRGHPLLLSLAATQPTRRSREVRQYVEEEIWRGLPVHQRRTLELASVFRRTAPALALRGLARGTDAVLRDLEAKTLLETTVSGDYFVHETIREYVLARLRKEQRQRLHYQAVLYFLGRPTSRERLEALHHLIAANRRKEAATFLSREGSSLLDSVSASDVGQFLQGFPAEDLDADDACILWEALGDSLRVLGHLTPAKFQYHNALRQATAGALPQRIPRLLRKLAFLERCRGNLAAALGDLVEARARLSQHPEPLETAEVLREMALVEQAQGHLDAAVAYENEAVDRATEASDPAVLARSLSVLGTLLTQKGDVEQGLQHKLESLRIAERAGNLAEMSRSDITIGTSYHELRRFGDALAYYQKGLQIARLLGNLRLTAVAAVDCAVALLDLHRYAEAGQPIEEARHFFGILGEPQMLAVVDINEGQRLMGLGRWALATRRWEKGLRALRKAGDSYEMLRSLDDVAGHYFAHGDVETARDLWREALRLARGLGNQSKIAGLEAALAGTETSPSARPGPSGHTRA